MRNRQPTRWGVLLGWATVLFVVVICWGIHVHNQRRLAEDQQTREKAAQDAADRAAGIIPNEDLVDEEYE